MARSNGSEVIATISLRERTVCCSLLCCGKPTQRKLVWILTTSVSIVTKVCKLTQCTREEYLWVLSRVSIVLGVYNNSDNIEWLYSGCTRINCTCRKWYPSRLRLVGYHSWLMQYILIQSSMSSNINKYSITQYLPAHLYHLVPPLDRVSPFFPVGLKY